MSLYKPTGRKPTTAKTIPLAPRPSSLKGKIVALYHNDKICSFPILKTVGELMREKFGVETIEVHSRAPFSKHPERCIDEAIKADAVILSSADWGSCTAWLVDAAVRIEKRGKPTCVLSAPGFREEVVSHSEMDGIPSLPFVVIEYAQHAVPLIPPATTKVFGKMVKAITMSKAELEKKIPGEVL